MTSSSFHRASDISVLARPLRRGILGLVLFSPLTLTLIYINHFGVNVPFWDQSPYLELVQKWYSHTATLYDLLVQHNEHRIVFPILGMVGLGFITDYNTVIPWRKCILVGSVYVGVPA